MATNDISKKIIIKKEYFDNIKTTIDSINSFFSSNFKDKNFPIVDSDFQLDSTLLGIVSWLNNVEPAWISDPSRVDSVIEAINKTAEDMEGDDIYSQLVNENNTVVLDHINAFVGYKVLQYIADYFTEFNKFINGIYTFELYTKPSKYRDVIDLFSKPIPISEIEDVMGNAEYRLFDRQKYVTGVFSNNQITLPDTLKQDAEINRLENNDDLDIEIVVDESVQEAAEVNYFEETKPEHLKYDEKKDKWVVSKQFEKAISKLISTLRKCDTTEDLKAILDKKGEVPEPDTFTSVVIPFILARTYSNPNKYMNENYDKEAMKKYTDSYDSITNKNNGAKRFAKYDIFSTFKTDKEGTIKFIEDFLKLNLVNDESAYISNNTLLTLFNIFDSRIYLDIMYNMLPDKVKKSKYPTEDGFVKLVRARINKNSRSANVYKPDTKVKSGNDVQTSEEIQEYVADSLKEFGDMSIADMMYCEHYQSLIHDEIKCLGDAMYNKGMSQIQVDNYIGESYNIFDKEDGFIQEQEMGDIPDYMRNRIKLSDETGNNPEVTTTDVQLPPDVPANPVDDLVTSIDAKLSAGGGLEDMLGSGYNDNPNKNHHEGKVVYNITNNYNNSFNRNSNNTNTTTQNDLSTGKTTTTTNTNTNSYNKRYTTHKNPNNYNNSTDSSDTKDSTNMISQTEYATFSTGNSIHDVFTFLESEEPLSDGNDSKPPKGDLLTHAMDRDREKLSKHQERKKTTQKIINTGRAVVKPIARTKKRLTDLVDSLIKRDEDKVKADIIEKPGFRTALFKAGRLALKLGLTGVAFTINGYVGMAYLALQGAKIADRERLKKEVQEEFAAELEILNDKIRLADADNTKQSRKDKWQMMRLRSKMEHIVAGTPRSRIRRPTDIV